MAEFGQRMRGHDPTIARFLGTRLARTPVFDDDFPTQAEFLAQRKGSNLMQYFWMRRRYSRLRGTSRFQDDRVAALRSHR